MAAPYKKTGEDTSAYHKITITLTSRDVRALEKVCRELVNRSKNQHNLPTKGPIRIPTKVLSLTVRKAPSGNGTATFDRFEMKIHKRVIRVWCAPDTVRTITNITIAPGVEVEVTIDNLDA